MAASARLVASVVGLAALTTACGSSNDSGSPRIAHAEGLATDSAVVLTLNEVCGQDFDVSVLEDDDTVTVLIDVEPADEGCDALVSWRIDLEAPLGDRALIDGATGTEVPVTAPDET
ncbi:hypothetical protein [uncultured Demequina sp.]|uniref:hypothetical protein n=1 Tax=uncultured Demequina sp. TaxID=693499 RepID=UPI0025EE3230|nr:hypothetical protein [uncultured Demequina sp.]